MVWLGRDLKKKYFLTAKYLFQRLMRLIMQFAAIIFELSNPIDPGNSQASARFGVIVVGLISLVVRLIEVVERIAPLTGAISFLSNHDRI